MKKCKRCCHQCILLAWGKYLHNCMISIRGDDCVHKRHFLLKCLYQARKVKWAVMYLCGRVSIVLLSTILIFDFGTVPTGWYLGTVPTVWYFGTVPTVWYFRTVPTVWYFRTVPTVWYFRTVPKVWYFRTVSTVWYFGIVPTVWYFCFSFYYQILML